MKKVLSLVLTLVLVVSAFTFVGCGKSSNSYTLKIGCIMIRDKNDAYTKAHEEGIKEAAKSLGIDVATQILWREKVGENANCSKAAKDLIGNGCSLIISNSFGHQDYMAKVAKDNPKVNFVSMTGNYAAISGLDNFYNAFTKIYEAKYVSGVVAGMKIKELDEQKKIPKKSFDKDRNVKVGYIVAYDKDSNAKDGSIDVFPEEEIVSGYTAFYLGIKSVYKNVVMDVDYTSERFSAKKEAESAEKLIKKNCVIIGQHTDSKGASSAVEKAKKEGAVVYSVGNNKNMLDEAPTAALTSSVNYWKTYYTELLKAVKDDENIPQDWAEGYSKNAVGTSKLGPEVAKGTEQKVEKVIEGLKDGSIQVFDTKTFTVGGKEVESEEFDLSYKDSKSGKIIYKGDTKECIESKNGNSFFSESTLRSAPYFSLKIDGITELNAQ